MTIGFSENRLVIPLRNCSESHIIMLDGVENSIFSAFWPLVAKHLRDYHPKVTQLLLVTDCTVADLYLPKITDSFQPISTNYQLLSYTLPPGTYHYYIYSQCELESVQVKLLKHDKLKNGWKISC